MSGVEPNPGPCIYSMNVSCINFNSVVQKGALVIDPIKNHSTHRVDALAACENVILRDDPVTNKYDCIVRTKWLLYILHLP